MKIDSWIDKNIDQIYKHFKEAGEEHGHGHGQEREPGSAACFWPDTTPKSISRLWKRTLLIESAIVSSVLGASGLAAKGHTQNQAEPNQFSQGRAAESAGTASVADCFQWWRPRTTTRTASR